MGARCESIGKYVLPVFRASVAKELTTTYKLTQVEAAKRLGTTQAAISQYINSKRALKGAEQLGNVMPRLQAMARETAKNLAEHKIGPDEIFVDFCRLCNRFPEEKTKEAPEDFTI